MRVKSVGGSPAAMLPSKLEDVMAVVEEGQVKGSLRGFHSRDTVFESVAAMIEKPRSRKTFMSRMSPNSPSLERPADVTRS